MFSFSSQFFSPLMVYSNLIHCLLFKGEKKTIFFSIFKITIQKEKKKNGIKVKRKRGKLNDWLHCRFTHKLKNENFFLICKCLQKHKSTQFLLLTTKSERRE